MNLKEVSSVRIDKWLWAVRICKTRSLARDLCKRGKVFIDEQLAKTSRDVKPGQIISLKKDGILWRYEVCKCIDTRVSAPLAAECKVDVTLPEEKERLSLIRSSWTPRRAKGEGRPTKKDRRALDRLKLP